MSGQGFVVWFTGMSGTGKSTLASMLAAELRARDVHVEVLDGDEMRTHLSKGLGFSREDRDTNVRRVGFVAKLVARSGACAMTAAISPYRATRDEQRKQIGRFVEIYLRAPVPVLSERDPKGLYKKALAGEIKHFTGIDDPYEEPLEPEVELDTSTLAPAECLARILETLERLGYLEPPRSKADGALPRPHGELPTIEATSERTSTRTLVTDDAASLAWIASGLLAPVHGPLGSKDVTRVAKEKRLENGLLFDAVPLVAIEGSVPTVGEVVALADRSGAVLASMEIAEVFADATGTRTLVHGPLLSSGAETRGVARSVRSTLERAGASRVAGLVTERPLHRGDEYLARIALERCDALVVVVASDAPAVRAAVRASLASELPRERVYLVEMPALLGLQGAALEITRVVIARNLGVRHVVCRDEDAPLARLVAERSVELGVVAHGPIATFALASGEVRSARTLPFEAEAQAIAWSAIEGVLASGGTPDALLFSRAAFEAWRGAGG